MTVNHVMIQNALRVKAQSLALFSTTPPTRASTATYTDVNGIVQTAAINVVRNANYVNGVGPAYLYESAATNLLLRSEQFDNAIWVKTGAGVGSAPVVTPNFATAPDGNSTADRIVFALNGGSTTSDQSTLVQGNTAADGLTYTSSFYLKSNTGSSYTMQLRNGGTSSIITVTPVWQRFSLAAANGVISTRWLALRGTFTGDTADILAWGAQSELGASATSYIPTVAATVTRAADVDSLIAATTTGYTRQTGSFLTEGFDVGMEIRPANFASNPIDTLTAVADLTLTTRSARSAESAVTGHSISVGMPQAFAWENVKFTPVQGIPYVEEDYIPGPMSLNSLGTNGNITAEPMYHLNVYVPQNSGIEADGGYADAILTLFAPSTEMILANGDKLFVRADIAPFQGQRQQISGNSVIPITIPLRLYTTNAI